jgi:hypothetical protein
MCGEVSEFAVWGKARHLGVRRTSRIWSPCLSMHGCDNSLLDAESGMKQKPCFVEKKWSLKSFIFLNLSFWSRANSVVSVRGRRQCCHVVLFLWWCIHNCSRGTQNLIWRWDGKSIQRAAKCWLISQFMFTAAHSSASHGMVQCMVVSEAAFKEHGTCLMPLHCLTDVKWRGISRMYIWKRKNSNFGDWCSVSTWRFKIPFPSDHCNLQWSSFHVSIASEICEHSTVQILKFCSLQKLHTWSAIFATSQSMKFIFMLLVSSWCFFHIRPLAASPVLSMPLA